ncbi:hypothetical protein SAMN05660748_2431 [Blastococcus aggregatus]|uniref:ARB-07466-like C-terminal domain-containing protein n=1 Tax=Blastococcus aggregatus TaxID=38502 RepID=A0A285V6L5_9ACTN|nr:hypothetical protein [Blastococcus aggregatus]SOC49699.1 hypothetical protein SAMN05660748_2431 [Blastococcus aggregatus]
MHPRTILNALHLRPAADRRPPTAGRRPAVYLGVAVAGAAVVNLVVGSGPAAHAEAVQSESVSVAEQLGVDGTAGPADVVRGLGPLAGLAASRSSREDAEFAAQLTQAAADQAVLDQQRAEAEAAARRAAEEAAAKRAAELAELAQLAELAAAQAKAAALAPAAKTPAAAVAGAAGSVAATTRAKISNSAGAINPRAQAAADAVVSNVPGAASITLGGTRASAADPGGHPSGLAVDYMVLSNSALGDAIVAYHVANWNALGVDYIIWKQRMLSSPGGAWKQMENRGSPTANHMDHPHVNYR